jgi:membrane protein implicated in regulation of membrane protease activity
VGKFKEPAMSEPDHHHQASVTLDDSGAGLAMFAIFTTAVLIVTGAVVLVALVGGWWILAVAFAIHALMTTVVLVTIISVMNGRPGPGSHRAPAETFRRETRPTTPIEPVTAP